MNSDLRLNPVRDSEQESIFWVGERVSPDSLEKWNLQPFKLYSKDKRELAPQIADYRQIRLQAEPSSHPLHPQFIGLIRFEGKSTHWTEWGWALLDRQPSSYLIRVQSHSMSVVKNHLTGLRFLEDENQRLVQWPWFRSTYFLTLCRQSMGAKRLRLFGPIVSVGSNRSGVWHCVDRDATPEVEQAMFIQLALDDYAQFLAQFLNQYRIELSIRPSVQLDDICSQAIPLAIAQGYCSAEMVGIWVMLGLIQAETPVTAQKAQGVSCALLELALQSGLNWPMLMDLTQRFKAWEDIRFPWLSGKQSHTIWDIQALSKIDLLAPSMDFNSTGVQGQITLSLIDQRNQARLMSPNKMGIEFQLMDDAGGASVQFEPDEAITALNQFLNTNRSFHPLLPAVRSMKLLPTCLNSMPLGHVNLRRSELERRIDLINRTAYGLTLSMPATPLGMVTHRILDGRCSPVETATCIWRDGLDRELFKASLLESREIYPALDVRMNWRLSDCASKVKLDLGLRWEWSEDFLILSAHTSLSGVDCTLRVRPTRLIDWRVDREVELPIDTLQSNAIILEDRLSIPLTVVMETCHHTPLLQVHLMDRLCGEVQLRYQVVYCEKTCNLVLRLLCSLSELELRLHESHLTLGQQKGVRSLSQECLLFGLESRPHG